MTFFIAESVAVLVVLFNLPWLIGVARFLETGLEIYLPPKTSLEYPLRGTLLEYPPLEVPS